ncbi:hypothetical protein [Micromonospora sp. NPDC049891]|uniref:hypothetical protein n=1 Tax=Micromonospora sp. NPDC049891 TaxID=3155655 RepID=UPI0033C0AD4C
MVVSLWAMTIPAAVADAISTIKAAKAGEWGLIDKQRDRKDARSKARRDALSKAWQNTRARRHKQAGGDGKYRPGMGAYLSDVYHGLWEDKLESRQAKRKARPPVGPDGKRPTSRVDAAVERKVQQRRDQSGMLGRAARALIDPVGESSRAVDTPPPPPQPETPVADGPRIACPVCGDTLREQDGTWRHPSESTCESARRPDGGHHVPWRVKLAAGDVYRLNREQGRSGALGETQTARDLHAMFGDQYPPHVYAQAAADATHSAPPPRGWMPQHDEVTTAALAALAEADPAGQRRLAAMDTAHEAVQRQFPNMHPEAVAEVLAIADQMPGCPVCGQRRDVTPPCVHQQAAADRTRRTAARINPGQTASTRHAGGCARCRSNPPKPGTNHCQGCTESMQSLRNIVGAAWFQTAPDGQYTPANDAAVAALVAETSGRWTAEEIAAEVRAARETETSRNNNTGGNTMSTDTIDLVDYNQAVASHEAALTKLRAQQAEAAAFEQHIAAVVAAVEAMDGQRDEVAAALAPLAEGLEASRYGADATQGSAEATSALTAGTIAEVQEHIEAARDRNQQWKAELDASVESVQASLQHIKSQYGEAAATVQETGVDARVLEEH